MLLEKSQIRLNNIRLYAYHGVLPQERKVGGWYNVSLVIDYPFDAALISDDVNDTLDYSKILEVVKDEMQKPSSLLEHVAGRIGTEIIAAFQNVTSLKVAVTKENPPMCADTGGASVVVYMTNEL